MKHPISHATILLALAAGLLGPPLLEARRVEAGPDEVIEVRARLRFATAVVLPEDEKILDWVCGDAEYWSVQGAANLAFVKPTAEGIRTNVTLVTDKGRVYTLLFRELGKEQGEPDLKLFLGPAGTSEEQPAALDPLRFEPRGAAAHFEQQAAEAREQARQAAERAQRRIEAERDRFRSDYPRTLRFDYVLDRRAGEAPFNVIAIWRRRPVHVHPGRARGSSRPVRRAGRPAVSCAVRLRRRPLRDPPPAGRRMAPDRQAQAPLPSDSPVIGGPP